jgi:signal recognition particle subunit SRP54
MFDDLTQKLDKVFRRLRGMGTLTEANIRDALRAVRRVLLESDVNLQVARDFLDKVQERAIGQEVIRSVSPAQQIIKIIHDELVQLLGGTSAKLNVSHKSPTVYMVVGLQGSGKTTFCAKLGFSLKSKGRRPLLVAADLQRPAAQDQLEVLAKSVGITAFRPEATNPVELCEAAVHYAQRNGLDPVILDTAGRLHIDDALMVELEEICRHVSPMEILFVADGMTGQDAVNSAKAFHERLHFSGSVLTKMDGDARGGAALSIRSVTGQPVKFLSVGEKLDALEVFHPDRMASRILGMGDVVSLVEKAQATLDEEQAEKLARKLRKQEFDFEDFLNQLRQLKKMGSLTGLLEMIPGIAGKFKDAQIDEGALRQTEAIILSMTPEERRNPRVLNGSRRRRIAQGSGTRVQDVNRLVQQYQQMRQMLKSFKGGGPGALRRLANRP